MAIAGHLIPDLIMTSRRKIASARSVRLTLVMVAATFAATPAYADTTLDVPAKHEDKLPLLVVLHGDRERADAAARRWRAAARERGWAVLSLQCPRDQGCKDSWWQWNGDPAWLVAQIDALKIPVDASRIVLVGWSGGATYIGMHAQAWSDRFAAIVIHGGGQAPLADGCPDRALPAYFLVGDKNPLHGLATDLRDWWQGCTKDVTWDLVRGADHEHEDRALDRKKALAILDWLAARPRR
jgi:poly(3-hydroxybutyrate) depolymerase